jgi:hypothetical protein
VAFVIVRVIVGALEMTGEETSETDSTLTVVRRTPLVTTVASTRLFEDTSSKITLAKELTTGFSKPDKLATGFGRTNPETGISAGDMAEIALFPPFVMVREDRPPLVMTKSKDNQSSSSVITTVP